MARRIPPLTALRAFEAAGRHLSFTKAADELHVTQAAVSHQVKSLEEHLGLRLFRRLNRTLLLTDAGQLYLPPLTDAFEGIDRATHRLRRQLGRAPADGLRPPLVRGRVAGAAPRAASANAARTWICASTRPRHSPTSGAATWTSRYVTVAGATRGFAQTG